MADDNHENGTSNGDVPEIELIIKVSVPCAIEDRRASETDRSERYVETIEREREEDGEKKEAIVPCALWAWSSQLVFVYSCRETAG